MISFPLRQIPSIQIILINRTHIFINYYYIFIETKINVNFR